METTVNTEILRARVDTFVLSALSEKDGYGYDILNYIHAKTRGHYEMKQSSIYSVLKRLEKQGYITSYVGDESNGAKRRYYRLTDQGREFLNEEKKEWAYARTLLDNLVTDMDFDLENDTPPFKPSDLRPMTKRSRGDEDFENDEDEKEKIKVENYVQAQNGAPYVTTPVIVPIIQTQPTVIPQTTTQLINTEKQTESEKAEAVSKDVAVDLSTVTEKNIETPEKPSLTLKLNDLIDKKLAERNAAVKERNAEYEQITIFESTTPTGAVNVKPLKQKKETAPHPGYAAAIERLFDKTPAEEKQVKSQDTQTVESKPILTESERLEVLSGIDKNERLINLKNELHNDGFTLKCYNKKEAENTDYMKFIYSNRINRDISVICYLFFVAELLFIYLLSDTFKYSGKALLVTGLCGLIVPAITLFIYALNPNRRIKSRFNFKMMLAYSILTVLTIFMLNLIISMLVSSISLTIKDAKLYPPVILSLPIILWVVLYQIFYNLKIYHIKNKNG